MDNYADAKHRPHGIHTDADPRLEIAHGPGNIRVTLNTWGPHYQLFTAMYDALQANWGDAPSRTVDLPRATNTPDDRVDVPWDVDTGWSQLTDHERDYVESCFAGKTLPQVLEMLTFNFTIDGVTRACTHELVRSRIGSGFMQHGGRDNDWRHRTWVLPETMRRADLHLLGELYETVPSAEHNDEEPARSCLVRPEVLSNYLEDVGAESLIDAIANHLNDGKALYAAMVDAGIPWQDARRVLPIGTATYLHATYSYPALAGVLANRLEHVMDWEINCVAQLMLRELKMHCPALISKYLGSRSDRLRKAAFAHMESWPPDGKWPVPESAQDVPHLHTHEQMPFWILSPEAMNGGDIEWIPTNGKYPLALCCSTHVTR
jgi:thymidylate synthase ThyX